ncbi:MAG: VanZ family protein [Bacteroidota bacterium]|nr:VanZ family protein [Bacteroidota bacterium]
MEGKKIPFKYFLPGIAWFFVVCILTLMPAKDVPQVGWMDNIPNFDKLVHAGLFGGLAFLFALPLLKSHFSQKQKLNYSIRISLAAIVWGITIEFLQKFYVPSRDFDLLDWAADIVGVIIALWLIISILNYLKKKNLQ